jgi:putative DNA primase/helicase
MMNLQPFLETLYGESRGFIEIRALGGQNGKPWTDFFEWDQFNEIRLCAGRGMGHFKNVYFGVATRDGKGGRKENIVDIPAVWVDIDFKDTPREAAMKALKDFPYKASIIIFSGNGVHVYFVLEVPLSPMDDATAIQRVEDANRRIAAYLGGDPASVDATRILRVPGTYNYKYDPPRNVKITYLEKFRYNLESFFEILPEVPTPLATTANGQAKASYIMENTAALMKCDFIRWCAEHPADVQEPLWHALVSNLASVRPGGVSLCHDLSKGHPGYSPEETNQKILHALEESRPISCAKIRERGFACKKSCGVTSPTGLVFEAEVEIGVQEDVKFAQISFRGSEKNNGQMALIGGPHVD